MHLKHTPFSAGFYFRWQIVIFQFPWPGSSGSEWIHTASQLLNWLCIPPTIFSFSFPFVRKQKPVKRERRSPAYNRYYFLPFLFCIAHEILVVCLHSASHKRGKFFLHASFNSRKNKERISIHLFQVCCLNQLFHERKPSLIVQYPGHSHRLQSSISNQLEKIEFQIDTGDYIFPEPAKWSC